MGKTLRTPRKNKIRGAAEFCTRKGIPYTKTELGRMFGASRMQVDYALQDHDDDDRTQLNSSLQAQNARKLTERNLDHVELVIEDNGPEGHDLNWHELIDLLASNVPHVHSGKLCLSGPSLSLSPLKTPLLTKR